MSVVWFRCDNCGAEPRLDAALITIITDLTGGRASIVYACPLCGFEGETGRLEPVHQTILLDGGATLAVRA
jgi:predicted RNA-binding Zn-ribbon protein involved in translation (DUF1610 family)